jgi:hypothetical protein
MDRQAMALTRLDHVAGACAKDALAHLVNQPTGC